MNKLKNECKCGCHELIGGYIKNCFCCVSKIEQIQKFICKCFCHHSENEFKTKLTGDTGHIGNKLVCCLYCPFCKIYIDISLEKEHKQFHIENKDI